MARKRKVVYPPSRSSKGAPPPRAPQITPPTVAIIDPNATKGRADIAPGMRVTVTGTGPAASESGVVESLVTGVIPVAIVRLDSGLKRRLRTVDLVPARRGEGPAPAAD